MNQLSNIKVSVIMPVYNSGKYLQTAVEHVLNQSLNELELILVDDGSTDGSSERCDKYASKDNRVVVIHEKNRGICAARNAALAIARGEYIGFSDHDDEMELTTFASAYSFAKANDLDMVKYGHDEMIIRGKEVLKNRNFSFQDTIYFSNESGFHYLEMLRDMAMDCVWDGLFRKSFLDQHNLKLNMDFKSGGEDIDFCGMIISCKPKVGLMSGVLYHHYIRIGFSTSSKFNELNVHNAMTFPHRLNKYLSSFNPNDIYRRTPFLYTFTIVRRSIGPVLYNISMPSCNWPSKKVKSLMEEIRNDKAINPIFFQVSKIKMFKYSFRYGLVYFAFVHRQYGLCLKMYEIRKR